jgi:hypothetical protein
MLSVLVGLTLAACAQQLPPVERAALPRNVNGTPIITDTYALELASYMLIDPARCKADPVGAIRSVAAVDYFATALQWGGQWPYISGLTKILIVQARAEVRQTLGIRPETPPQEVINRLFAAADALGEQDTAAVLVALTSPNFTLGPEATLARLTNLPYLPKANWAVQEANREAFQTNPGCVFGCR